MSSSRRRRVTNVNANYQLPSMVRVSPLVQFEDRRLFNPEGIYAPARSFTQPRHRLQVPLQGRRPRPHRGRGVLSSLWSQLPAQVGFQVPSRVLVCVRRKARKEVMHALRLSGKVGQRKPRWSYYSHVSCF